jgi:hypothetical protein
MTQKDKELLFKDLCARLPYVLYCNITDYTAEREEDENFDAPLLSIERTESGGYATFRFAASEYKIWNNRTQLVKPYLRPMSSMTEEEINEFHKLRFIHVDYGSEPLQCVLSVNEIDWLNAHHFDYRGLIEKGLAIAVTEDNNPYES